MRSHASQLPARAGAQAWGSFPLLWHPPAALLTSPIPSIFPQVLLPGAPPSADSAGRSQCRHQLHHLPGSCGRLQVLLYHGVPSLQKRLVPPGLHPGRILPRAQWGWRTLGSTRHRSHSLSLHLRCRDRPGALESCASSALFVKTRSGSFQKCSPWGSKSRSGWCPSARLCPGSAPPGLTFAVLEAKSVSASPRSGQQARAGNMAILCISLTAGALGLIAFPPFSGRKPTWWDDNMYPSLEERHQRCDVSKCLYPGGREQAEEEG